MTLIQLSNARLTLGGRTLFEGVDLRVGEQERIGLIGPNGSGKTTILRLFAGQLEVDAGGLFRRGDLRIGYLPQDIVLDSGKSVLALLRESVPGRQILEAELGHAEAALAAAETIADEAEREAKILDTSMHLAELHERLAHFESQYSDHAGLRILSGLGFATGDEHRDLGELSGGWQMRALLAALLFMQPDLLLLDEPTNHLDMPSVAWLSAFLRNYRHAFVLISHDREFLNEQINRVVSFEPEGIRHYRGNYEEYLVQRAEESTILANRQKNLQRERDKAEEFIGRFRAQASKARAVQSRIKALDKMEEVQVLDSHRGVSFRFPPCERASDEVLRIDNLAKHFGARRVFAGASLRVRRGDRVAIIGPNGAGKTTLLRVIAGELPATDGSVTFGNHVALGYFAQHHAEALDRDSTVYDEVSRQVRNLPQTQVRTLLGTLHFSGDDVDKRIGVLSGGERARVSLARILIQPRNLLLMDEPTNHLDLTSSESLAEALSSYDGTLVFVSHNRGFVRKLATRIWNVNDGKVEDYPGSLDDYLASSMRTLDVAVASSALGTSTPKPAADAGRGSDKDRRRRDAEARKLRRETVGPLEDKVASLEARIGELEAAQAERSKKLSDPGVYADEAQRDELLRGYAAAQAELETLTASWEGAATELEAARAALEAAAV